MTIDEMACLAYGLDLKDFDLLLVGDGAGTVFNKPCGWCCHYYDRSKGLVIEHRGGTSGGTNNFAELAPYIQGLWYYHAANFAKEATPFSKAPSPFNKVLVEIVSDSEVTVRCGNGQYARRANASLWAAVAWFEENGYALHWNHVPRNSNPANARADKVAVETRKAMEKLTFSNAAG